MSLVPISFSSDETSPLVVLIHDISGSVFSYVPFGMHSALSRNTISGIAAPTSPALFESNTFSLRTWAKSYVEVLETELQDELAACEGKIILGGWSLGGILAAEMARISMENPAEPNGASTPIRVQGLVFLDTYAPWHPAVQTLPPTSSFEDALPSTSHFTSSQLLAIHALLTRTGREEWPGITGCGCSGPRSTLITPSSEGANGMEDWFDEVGRKEEITKGNVLRIGQDKIGCDHHTMMQEQWVGEVANRVSEVLQTIFSDPDLDQSYSLLG